MPGLINTPYFEYRVRIDGLGWANLSRVRDDTPYPGYDRRLYIQGGRKHAPKWVRMSGSGLYAVVGQKAGDIVVEAIKIAECNLL